MTAPPNTKIFSTISRQTRRICLFASTAPANGTVPFPDVLVLTESISEMKKPTIEQSPVKSLFYRADISAVSGHLAAHGHTYRVSRPSDVACAGMAR
ncbi:hypothetical protein AGROH133_14966 (plasmid) [Agrobacterium tumefaciens]|nr:hypothetical protein AGROH133_14966 [Agrobacterium tumefaciens]